jgi:hypothetical protein
MASRNFELILKIVGSPPLWRNREIDVARNFQQLGTRQRRRLEFAQPL